MKNEAFILDFQEHPNLSRIKDNFLICFAFYNFHTFSSQAKTRTKFFFIQDLGPYKMAQEAKFAYCVVTFLRHFPVPVRPPQWWLRM